MTLKPLMAEIDEDVLCAIDAQNLPGAALALIEGGEIFAIRTYGYTDVASVRTITDQTQFSLQSVSKSLAAWGVMALVEDGLVDLDLAIDEYLTRWRLPATSFDRRLVTARRLLSHHAGISTSGFPGIAPAFPDVTLIDGLNGNLPPLSEDQLDYWRRWDLGTDWAARITYPPGEGWHYSNAGFGILELIVEQVTSSSFADFMQQRILRPLGMHDSTYRPAEAACVATAYRENGDVSPPLRYLSQAAGGLYATIGDLAKFACAEILSAGRPGRGIISEASLRHMFTSHGFADATPEIQFETGLGHLLFSRNGLLNVHHSGGSIGWRSVYSVFPDKGAGLCMLVNSDGGNALWIPQVRSWREMIQANG